MFAPSVTLGTNVSPESVFFWSYCSQVGEPRSEPALLPHEACGRCPLGEHIHPHNLSLADSLIHSLDTFQRLLITRRAAGPGSEVGRTEP